MNKLLREFLEQQMTTCETALSCPQITDLQKEFWEGRKLANQLVMCEGCNHTTQETTQNE